MRIISITVILLLWPTKRLTEATLPGIGFLLPLPPPTQKVATTHSPLLPPPSQRPPEPGSGHYENQFRLQKLHQTEHSTATFVSTNTNSHPEHRPPGNNNSHQPPPMQHRTIENFVSLTGQEGALATNQGTPHRSPTPHHQPVPLTFPPSSGSSSDLYSLPRVISLPPYPSSQHVPHSSTYSTASTSYSFAQGFRPSYGPPKTTKIVRHVSVFVSPPQDNYGQSRPKIRVQGQAEKHINYIFIKGPEQSTSDAAEIEIPAPPEQLTKVYVLNKQNDGESNVIVNTPEPPKYNPPDVYFIQYKNQKNQQGEQGSSYGAPPQQHQPSSQYGAPPQQHQPSTEYGAPSNQNFTYTLPITKSSNNSFNHTIISNLSRETQNERNSFLNSSNRSSESRSHQSNSHFFTSSQQQSEAEKELLIKLENQKHRHQGLFSQLSRDVSNAIMSRKSDIGNEVNVIDEGDTAKQHNKREEQTTKTLSPTIATNMNTTTKKASNTNNVKAHASTVKYNAVADVIGDVRLLMHYSNKTGSNNIPSVNNSDILHKNRSIDDWSTVLSKRNLTTSNDDLDMKGNSGNVSGRLDDFRSYQYAPLMDYNYFGVIGYQAVE